MITYHDDIECACCGSAMQLSMNDEGRCEISKPCPKHSVIHDPNDDAKLMAILRERHAKAYP